MPTGTDSPEDLRSPWPNTLYLDSFQPKEVVVSVFALQAAWAVWGQCTRRLSNVVEQTIETSLSLPSGKRVGKSPARTYDSNDSRLPACTSM